MAMPQDAINAILAVNPSHLWVMNETSGTTFADQVTPGGVALTAGSSIALNLGTLTSSSTGFGGPGTPAPMFDGTVNSACTIPGKTVGGLASWTVCGYCYGFTSTASQVLYAEAGPATTSHLVCRFNGGAMEVTYRDTGHALVTASSGSSTSGNLGSGLFAYRCNAGFIVFFKGGVPAYASNSNATLPATPSAWNETVSTSIGVDPQAVAPPFLGMLGWVFTVPTALTDAQIFALNQALSPNPPNCYTWSRATSGAMFPNSEMWNSPLPDNTTPDPNSFAKIINWGTFLPTNRVALGGGGTSLVDANRASAAGYVSIKDAFYATTDQVAFLGACNAPATFAPSVPQPSGGGNDSLGSGVELDRGRTWDCYLTTQVAPTNVSNRHPQWNPDILATSITTGSGTLAAGWYFYWISVVTASGLEGGGFGYGENAQVDLTSTGTINLTIAVDKNGWADPPDHWRIYRRGPYATQNAGASADYGLLTTIPNASWVNYTAGNNIFHDTGALTPDTTQKPLLTIVSTLSLTVSGTNNAGQNILTVRANAFAFNDPTYGVPNYLTVPYGPITLGTGGTAESIYVTAVINSTQLQLLNNLQFTHNDGETTSAFSSVLGAAGNALGPEITTKGGGGSWDWYNNAAFYPCFSPSVATNNGESASSRPCQAGTITAEEGLNGSIQHPMVMALLTTILSINKHVWPAPRSDGAAVSTAVNLFGEGTRFRLPPGFPVNLIAYSARTAIVTAFQQAFATAMTTYGTFIGDGSPGGGLYYLEDTSAEVGRNDTGWIYGGLASGATSVTSILDFMFVPGVTITGNTTQGSATVTSVSSFTGVAATAWINNPAVMPYATQVLSTNSGAGTLTLTQPATATATGVSLYLGLFYQLQVILPYRYPAKVDSYASFTANVTAGSAVLTNVSNLSNIIAGLVLSGTGILLNSTVSTFDPVGNTITMTQNAETNGTAVSITAGRRSNRTSVGTINTVGFQQLVPY